MTDMEENRTMTLPTNLPVNSIIEGDCIDVLSTFPEHSVDLIVADPPYHLQIRNALYRPNRTKVDAVDADWDRFESFQAYDTFTRQWLAACKRVLKPTGTIWVMGTYHNIFRVGAIMQDLGYWILNDVIWIKTNPMPNFRGVRFTNAHETLIWASTGTQARYTFHYHTMKQLNDGKQMRSDWWILSSATRSERIRDPHGKKAHPTQKPEALLYRIILSSSNPGDLVLDPFFGSGTTGVVAKRLQRYWIGIEREPAYIDLARRRIDAVVPAPDVSTVWEMRTRRSVLPRVTFADLVEHGYIQPGQRVFFQNDPTKTAVVTPAATVRTDDGMVGSIHQVGRRYLNGAPCNGWDHWVVRVDDRVVSLDAIRAQYRHDMGIPDNALSESIDDRSGGSPQ
jgi:modification methylase